jgi:hypothetical protein
MELEQLQAQWRLLDQKVDQALSIQKILLRQTHLQSARRHLRLLAFWPIVDLAFGVAVLLASGSCLGDHWSTPSVALPSVTLWIAANVFTIGNIYQLANVGGIIWDGPIGSIQVAMSRLRRARIRQFKWAVLSGPLVWFCAMCVGSQALFGVNLIESFDRAWVITNIVFGVLFIPCGGAVARILASHCNQSSWWKGALDGISGRSLAAAQRDLDQWTAFAQESSIEPC